MKFFKEFKIELFEKVEKFKLKLERRDCLLARYFIEVN